MVGVRFWAGAAGQACWVRLLGAGPPAGKPLTRVARGKRRAVPQSQGCGAIQGLACFSLCPEMSTHPALGPV